MTVVMPEGTSTLGNTKIAAVLDITDMAAPSLAGEVNDVTSVDASCYLYPSGWTPSADTATGTKPPRLCSKNVVQSLNRTTYSLGALQYVHDPQAADAAAGNELREILQPGAKVFLVERQGLDAQDTPFAAAQRVIVHHVELGPQVRSGDRTDENGEFFITQVAVYVDGSGPVEGVIAA